MNDIINPFIAQFVTLTGPTAVVVYLVMIGYAVKMCPWVPNKYIPLVNFLLGPLLGMFLVAWPQSGDMPEGVRYPETAAWFTAILRGFLLACAAWVLHEKLLRQLIDDKVEAWNANESASGSQKSTPPP